MHRSLQNRSRRNRCLLLQNLNKIAEGDVAIIECHSSDRAITPLNRLQNILLGDTKTLAGSRIPLLKRPIVLARGILIEAIVERNAMEDLGIGDKLRLLRPAGRTRLI
jgi:hypothetical protein